MYKITNQSKFQYFSLSVYNYAGLPVLFFSPPSPDDCYTVEVGRQFQVDCSVFGEVHPSHSVLSSGKHSSQNSLVSVWVVVIRYTYT